MQPSRRLTLCLTVFILSLLAATTYANLDYAVKLKTGDVLTDRKLRTPALATALEKRHIMIQFEGPITDDVKDRLADEGITLLDYIPNFTYTAKLDRLPDQSTLDDLQVRWFDAISPDQKISPYITEIGIREYSRRGGDLVQFHIILHPDEDNKAWGEKFVDEFDAEIVGYDPILNSVELILPEVAYYRISEYDGVLWIEQALPRPQMTNNSARENLGTDLVQQAPYNLDGNGVMLAEWDGGRADINHTDLEVRMVSMDASDFEHHATHVAATVLGSGGSRPDLQYRGMAPGARMLTQQWWSSSSNMVSEYETAILAHNAEIGTNSWGYGAGDPVSEAGCEGTMGDYYSVCTSIDNVVRGAAGHPMTIVWSAGNQRGSSSKYCGSIGWTYNTVTPLPTSKNVIAVGAVNSNNSSMTSFSSWGPTDDGRVKPDVTGPGCQSNYDGGVTSAKVGSGYTTMCGTSMSAPAVAGVLALMKEQWNLTHGVSLATPSTMKGILINSATDLGNPGPDYQFGHGNVDAPAAVTKVAAGEASYVEADLSTGDNHLYDLTVPGGASKLRVTIVWDDPGGTVSASQHLKNDLDLVLIDPFGSEVYPWILDPANPSWTATKGVDRINNVETVGVDSPYPGLWKAKVTGYNIPFGPQTYSLIFTPDGINQPGNLAALAVFDNGDLTVDPGATTDLDFWVTNVGANPESIRIEVTDDLGWLNTTIDSTVLLAPFDSAYVTVSATVPPGSLADEFAVVTCLATSTADEFVTAEQETAVITAPVYDIAISNATEPDTVASPSDFDFSATVYNYGNGTDVITVTPGTIDNWPFTPSYIDVSVDMGSSAEVFFTANVPPEVIHMSENLVTVTAQSTGLPSDETSFVLYGYNPFFPPTLLAPSSASYVQDGTPDFSWTSDGDSYNLYVATDIFMSNVIHTYTGIAGTSFTLPTADSLGDGTYFWAVRKYDGADSSSIQRDPFMLVVDNTPPHALLPDRPRNNLYLTDQTVNFICIEETGFPIVPLAPEYLIFQVARDSLFTDGLVSYEPLYDITFTPPPLDLGRWYWRATSTDSAGNANPWTPTYTFLIDIDAPQTPELIYPADQSAVDTDSVTFRWTTGTPPAYDIAPEYFYVHISNTDDFSDWTTFNGFVYTDSVKLSSEIFLSFQDYFWRVKANDSAGFFSEFSPIYKFQWGQLMCGDLDNNGKVTLSDITALIDHVYISKQPLEFPSVGNVNGSLDGSITLSDITRLIDHVYLSKQPLGCVDL